MRFDSSDLDFLRPLVLEAMQQLAIQIGACNALFQQSRIGLTEAEAAAAIGVRNHVLRDCRLRGEIFGRKVGRGHVYSRDELFNFLNRPKPNHK